jgi:hypothetical protein
MNCSFPNKGLKLDLYLFDGLIGCLQAILKMAENRIGLFLNGVYCLCVSNEVSSCFFENASRFVKLKKLACQLFIKTGIFILCFAKLELFVEEHIL